MNQHFNELSPAEAERLALLLEECGEVQQVIGKILRHGYESFSPVDADQIPNRALLEQEIGDMMHSIHMLVRAGDLKHINIALAELSKMERVKRYLHHQG